MTQRLMPLGVILVAAALGALVGLGGAAIIAGLTAMFCLMAAFGGTLGADLRLLAWFGPMLVLVSGTVRLLSGSAPWVALAFLVLVVFAGCLLPVLGTRYVTVGLGLGMASVFSYGLHTVAVGTAAQVYGAPALAVFVVGGLRWLLGRKDPAGPLRTALADLLDTDVLERDTHAGQEAAARLWLADRPRRWTTDVLAGTYRYHNAAQVLATRRRLLAAPVAGDIDQHLADAGTEARRLAEALRPVDPEPPPEPVRRREAGASAFPGATRQLVNSMWQGLELVRAALVDRDPGRAQVSRHTVSELLFGEVRGMFSWESIQLRHALRCALGMLVALLVASRRPTDPFAVAFLMSTFAIMQPQWRDTLARAGQRVLGSVLGAMVIALVVWLFALPQPVLLSLGVVALLVGFTFIRTRPVVGNACLVFMSVVVNSGTRHLDPRGALLEYLGLIALAVLIGLGFGFAAIPGVRQPGLAQRLDRAVRAEQELLRTVSPTVRSRHLDRRKLNRRFRAATNAQQNLIAQVPGRAEDGNPEPSAAEAASDGLRGLTVTASALVQRVHTAGPLADAIDEVACQLAPAADPDPARVTALLPHRPDGEQRLLVDSMVTDLLAVHRALAQVA